MHRDFESRRDAEEGRKTHEALCEECTEGDVRIALNPDRPDGRAPRAEGDGVPAMGPGEAPAEGSSPRRDVSARASPSGSRRSVTKYRTGLPAPMMGLIGLVIAGLVVVLLTLSAVGFWAFLYVRRMIDDGVA